MKDKDLIFVQGWACEGGEGGRKLAVFRCTLRYAGAPFSQTTG